MNSGASQIGIIFQLTTANLLFPLSFKSTRRSQEHKHSEAGQLHSTFAYFHVEGESSFSLVDTKVTAPRKVSGFNKGRGTTRARFMVPSRGSAKRGGPVGRGDQNQRNPHLLYERRGAVALLSLLVFLPFCDLPDLHVDSEQWE